MEGIKGKRPAEVTGWPLARCNSGGPGSQSQWRRRTGRRRWLQVDEMPFNRAITYKLIDAGLISSVVVTWPGSRRGRRLIDGDSLDSYLETLTAKQALAEAKPNEAAEKPQTSARPIGLIVLPERIIAKRQIV